MFSTRLLATLTVIAATAIVPASAAARTAETSGQSALGTRAGGEVISEVRGFFDIPAELTSTRSARPPAESDETIAADRRDAGTGSTFDSHTRPHADGIIAILIGAVAI